MVYCRYQWLLYEHTIPFSSYYSIDATQEDGSVGKLHSHNVEVKIVASDIRPYLCMFAATEIQSGQKLLYDYGERSIATILLLSMLGLL